MANYLYVFVLIYIVNSVLSCDITDTEIVQQHDLVELSFKLDKITDVEDIYEIQKPGGNVLYMGFPGQFKLLKIWINESNRINVIVNDTKLFTFQLENVTSQDAGVYCCTSGGIIVPRCGVKLIVTDKPNIRLSAPPEQPVLQPVNGKLLGEISLTCNATSTTIPTDHNLPMIYRWFKHGIYYDNGRILQDRDVDITDTGDDIICIATDDPGCKITLIDLTHSSTLKTVIGDTRCKDVLGISDNFILQPEYGPCNTTLIYDNRNLTPGEEMEKPVGEELSVNCMNDCYPACNISWYKDGQRLGYNPQLNLQDVQESDDGVYTCTVYNIHATRNIYFILDIYNAPEETGGRGVVDIRVAVGQNVSTTKTIRAYPQPYILQNSSISPVGTGRQYISFVLLNTTIPHQYYLILTVYIINIDYLGKYCVDVQNEGGNLTLCNNFKDPVCCPPKVNSMSSDNVTLVDVAETIITLREITGYPRPSTEAESMVLPVGVNSHYQYINYTLINTTKPHHYNLSLSVYVVTKHYIGKYCIYLKNKHGELPVCHTLMQASNDVINNSTGITATNDPINISTSGIIINICFIGSCLLIGVLIIGLILVKNYFNQMAGQNNYEEVSMQQFSTDLTTPDIH